MISLAAKLRTAYALGVPNLARVALYRAGVRYGLNPVRRLRAPVPKGPFFAAPAVPPSALPASAQWRIGALWFGRWPVALGPGAPDWHANPLNGQRVPAPLRNWWEIADFDPAVGDIKLVWEGSRFDWVLALAQRTRNGEPGALEQLNAWVADWCASNPPYLGSNWKCGQEASIRVMHLAMAALILGQHQQSAPGLLALLRLHLARIAPTIGYAVAQDNNHGSSEAAALFMGGSWLAAHGEPQGRRWARAGRRWLENRVQRLIAADGSFSQHSLTYHRMMLDTLCMAEVWRARLSLPAFSNAFYGRARVAAGWLFHMVDPDSGDGPNLGTNDGARLLQLSDGDYRDFRPSVQLAASLFCGARAYHDQGEWNLAAQWLDVSLPAAQLAPAMSKVFDHGGFAVLRCGPAMAMLRYPRFRFRPAQADALHVDLWLGAANLLRDAGSYSYNAESQWSAYFPGTGAHNTVQFDERDQMLRWSRFLYADWLCTSATSGLAESGAGLHFSAAYAGRQGESHTRELVLGAAGLLVRDRVAGFTSRAVLRWRLAPGAWRIEGHSVRLGDHVLAVTASVPLARFELVEGWESRYYLEKSAVQVLEIEINIPGELTSEYRWEA